MSTNLANVQSTHQSKHTTFLANEKKMLSHKSSDANKTSQLKQQLECLLHHSNCIENNDNNVTTNGQQTRSRQQKLLKRTNLQLANHYDSKLYAEEVFFKCFCKLSPPRKRIECDELTCNRRRLLIDRVTSQKRREHETRHLQAKKSNDNKIRHSSMAASCLSQDAQQHTRACSNFKRAHYITPKHNHLIAHFCILPLVAIMLTWYGEAVQIADPRPTIYSGQVSFALLLSAHTTPGTELSTSASNQQQVIATLAPEFIMNDEQHVSTNNSVEFANNTSPLADHLQALASGGDDDEFDSDDREEDRDLEHDGDETTSATTAMPRRRRRRKSRQQRAQHERRQIFERPSAHQMRRQQQQQQQQQQQHSMKGSTGNKQQLQHIDPSCGQVNSNALYAGMGAIWASHQANLVGDSQLAIGTYVYDSCNDLDVGQRQSVRIVSNLNAFQQTTCESPRGSPISLTIAHGDNQLRAIQLLTSFRVPVITTKEPFALEDYHLLSKDQRRFLFSTAPSSRHLAVGAIKFSKRVVSRAAASPKLANQHYKMSSKNGLIVISRNLPAKFIAYLTETIPNHVNYEMLHSSQPIDQVRSVEVLESILAPRKAQSSTSDQQAAASSGDNDNHFMDSNIWSHHRRRLRRRRDTQDVSQDTTSSSSGASDSDDTTEQLPRMLSPTILMFITPAEAIDLVTRLRNDLAEVSRFYSLIVTTREDISPALRTIFHRGGSRLCSGKSFYTISPKPDDVNEFSRYFRDTVQMEGESSDHPLICEYAKYQSTSRINADLDDISTESVIKAVWSAAAAFKLVHKRECSSAAAGGQSSSEHAHLDSSNDDKYSRSSASAAKQGRRQSTGSLTSSGSSKSAHAECMAKMSKNMSQLVQRALKKLDVNINSTGLQALDGFRIKFDESNELLTNKFSIRYVNKECEITELGQYSGHKDSQLHLDEDTLIKSLESTLPDPWPATSGGTSGQQQSSVSSSDSSSSSATSGASPQSATMLAGVSGGSTGGSSDSQDDSSSPSSSSGDVESSSSKSSRDDESNDTPSNGQDNDKMQSSILIEKETPKRRRSDGKVLLLATDERKNESKQRRAKKQPSGTLAPITSLSEGRAHMPTSATTQVSSEQQDLNVSSRKQLTTNGPTLMVGSVKPEHKQTDNEEVGISGAKVMRKLKPFPSAAGAPPTLKDWLPKEQTVPLDQDTQAMTTSSPLFDQMKLGVDQLVVKSTTLAPVHSTLPESGGNTDLEMPTFKSRAETTTSTMPPTTTTTTSTSAPTTNAPQIRRQNVTTSLDTAESADYVTLPSIVRQSTHHEPLKQANNGRFSILDTQSDSSFNSIERQRIQNLTDTSALLNTSPDDVSGLSRTSHLRDFLTTAPVPLVPPGASLASNPSIALNSLRVEHENNAQSAAQSGRSQLRSHFKWIYGSWFTLSILGANICGALLTLYVLTFLLMKNCDGSLDRDNQAIRSLHLLAIIVVFFGSTLFIVYPTPSLCLLRTSWHNFALVLVFGTLLLQTMQTRSLNSLGLGGRPNRLNQFLTFLFMVGVQVSFELQRWKYESANYLNFVSQYFSTLENGDKKLIGLSNSIASQFNPLNAFNDQVTPVSIQVSEKYQHLLHDYCTPSLDDFLQSQVYLWIIICLLIIFSVITRRQQRQDTRKLLNNCTTIQGARGLRKSGKKVSRNSNNSNNNNNKSNGIELMSGKLLASQHETNNLNMTPSINCHDDQITSTSAPSPYDALSTKLAQRRHAAIGNIFLVTLISTPIYFCSLVLHVHGPQNIANHDLISSVSMVLIAFTILIGTFLPYLRGINRYNELSLASSDHRKLVVASQQQPYKSSSSSSSSLTGALTKNISTKAATSGDEHQSSPSSSSRGQAFAMFPEFAATGLRRPSSIGADSSSGHAASSRRPFAESKESRRNMGVSLANLPIPSEDSLRSLCAYNNLNQQHAHHTHHHHHNQHNSRSSKLSDSGAYLSSAATQPSSTIEPALFNLKLNMDTTQLDGSYEHETCQQNQLSHYHPSKQQCASSRRSITSGSGGGGERRLIMLDVDPCCPRHGNAAAWSSSTAHNHGHVSRRTGAD